MPGQLLPRACASGPHCACSATGGFGAPSEIYVLGLVMGVMGTAVHLEFCRHGGFATLDDS
eukprot:3699512-Alexandrium_andersonii.AAC.1